MLQKNFTPFPVLITQRLTLRQLSESDQHEIWALRSDVQINKYLGRKPTKTLEEATTFINQVNDNINNGDSIYWGIANTGHTAIIGAICLFNFSDEDKKCEIGYELLTQHQGQGIMTEAAEKVIEYAIREIGLHGIEAFTHKDNEASIKLLDKLNFQKWDDPDNTNGDLWLFRLVPGKAI